MPQNDQFSPGANSGVYGSGEPTGNIVIPPVPAGLPGGVPAAPQNLIASDNQFTDKVVLTWNAAAEALRYKIYRNDEIIQTTTSTNFDDTTSIPGEVYVYYVIAENNSGLSQKSNDDLGSKKLSSIQNLAVQSGPNGDSIILNWTGISSALKYKIYRGLSSQITNMVVIDEINNTTYTDTRDIIAGRNYFYIIVAVGNSGDGEYSIPVSVVPDLVPPTSTILTASDGTFENKIVLNWTQSDRAVKYKIFRNSNLLAETVSLTYEDTAIQQGIVYTYSVIAVNSASLESTETTNSINTGWAKLSAPQFLNATYETNEFNITISWSAVQNATSYNIYRFITGTPIKIDSVSGSTFTYVDTSTDNDLLYENQYRYFVRAVTTINGVQVESANSPTATGKLAEPTPVAPTLTASTGNFDDRIELNWNSVNYATSYTIYRNGSFLTTVTTNSYTDTSVDPAVNYSYKAFATNSRGSNGPFSNEITNAWRKLPAPTLTATGGSTQITLSWNSITNATSYKVYRGIAPGEENYTLIATVTTNSYNDTNTDLISEINYYYSVSAVNSSFGEGTLSSFEDAVLILIPSQPQSLSATQGSFTDKITLSWTTEPDAASHTIFRNSIEVTTIQDIDNTDTGTYYYDDFTADSGISYTYTVRSNSLTASSSLSSSASGWKQLPAPLNLTASNGVSSSQILVSWDPVVNATSYKLHRRVKNSGSPFGLIATTSTTNYSDTNTDLLYSTEYEYSVKSSNVLGDSNFSNIDVGYLDDVSSTNILIPSIPTGVSATQDKFTDRIVVTWNASTNADGYYVYRNGTRIADVEYQIFYDESLTPGTTNSYYIIAYNNDSGVSGQSSTVTGKTKLKIDICNISTNSDYNPVWAAAWHGVNQYSSGFTGKLGGRLAGTKSGGSFVTPNIFPMFWINDGSTWYNPGSQGTGTWLNGPHTYASNRFHSDPAKDTTAGGLVELKIYTTGAGGTPTRAKQFFDTLGIPVGRRVIWPWAFQSMLFFGFGTNAGDVKQLRGHPLDKCYIDNTNTTTENDGFVDFASPWVENGKNRLVNKFGQWISEFHSIGGSFDYIADDTEEGGGFSIWGITESFPGNNIGDVWMRAIINDPRFNDESIQPGLGSLSQQLQYDPTKPILNTGGTRGQFHPEIGPVGSVAPGYFGYTRWSKVLLRLFYKYHKEGIYNTAKQYFPNIKYSNYNNYYIPDNDVAYDFNAHSQPGDEIGNSGDIANSYSSYGTAGQILTNMNVDPTDPTRLIYLGSSSTRYGTLSGDVGFKALILEQNTARTIKRNSDAEFHPWISHKSFTEGTLQRFFNNNYWDENVYHLCMLVPEVIMYWNPSDTSGTQGNVTKDAAEDTLLNNILQEVNTLSGGGLCASQNLAKIAWNANSIISGAETKTGDWLWRISVDKGKGFNVVVFGNTNDPVNTNGDDIAIPSNKNGVWVRTNTSTIPIYTVTFAGPSTLTATSGVHTDKVVLSWSAVSNATTYNIYRNGSLLTTSTTTTFDDTTATPGTLFTYRVVAVVNGIESSNSPIVTGWRKLSIPNITSVSRDQFEDKINIVWSSVTGATSYNLYRATIISPSNDTLIASGLTTVSYDDTNTDLLYDTLYFYRIQAVCSLGSSDKSSMSNANYGRLKTPQPTPFVLTASENYTDRVELSWTTPQYASSAYVINRDGIPLTNGYSRANYLTYSNTLQLGSGAPSLRDWAQYNGASIGNSTKRMPNDSTNSEFGKLLTFATSGSGLSNNGIYQVISEPRNGETYTLSVWAATISGETKFRMSYYNGSSSVLSSTSPATDFTATTTPQRFSWTFTTTTDNIYSNIAIGNGSSNATGSIVIWGAQLEKGSVVTDLIVTTNTPIIRTEYLDYTAVVGTNYSYQVIAENRNNSRASNTDSGSRKLIPPVLNSVSSTLTDRITITWGAVAGASSYKIFRGTNESNLTLIQSGVTGTTFDDSNTDGTPLADTTYYYAVKASTSFATDSDMSNILNGVMISSVSFNGDIFENYFGHNITEYTNITVESQNSNVYNNHFMYTRFYSPMLSTSWNSLFGSDRNNRYTKQIFYSNKPDDTNTQLNYLERISIHNYGDYARNFPLNNRLYLNFDVYRGEGDNKYSDDIYCTTPTYTQLTNKTVQPTLPPK
jgi:hypothetical protein